MGKELRVEFSVSYDIIRKMFCVVSGKVLTDEKIDEMIPTSEVYLIDMDILGKDKKDVENMLGAVVLSQLLEDSAESKPKSKPKSRFEQRLEELKKQKENE